MYLQLHCVSVQKFDPCSAVNVFGSPPGHQFRLVYRLGNKEDTVLVSGTHAGYQTGMLASDGIMAVCREADHLGSPCIQQCVHQFGNHVENVDGGVPLKYWDGN